MLTHLNFVDADGFNYNLIVISIKFHRDNYYLSTNGTN